MALAIDCCLPILHFDRPLDYFQFMADHEHTWQHDQQNLWIRDHVKQPLFSLAFDPTRDSYVFQVRGKACASDILHYYLKYL